MTTPHVLLGADGEPLTIDGRPVTLDEVAAQCPRCLVCDGRPVVTVGVFVPHAARERNVLDVTEPVLGPVAPDKRRVAFYGLCRRCAATPETTARAAEAKLLGEPAP